jgi:large repetitive protein
VYATEISSFSMLLFDRWGNMIFESDDLYEGWDGRANGGTEIAQQDVYVYKVFIKDFEGKQHKYTGSVTLLK